MRLGDILLLVGASGAAAQWQGSCRSFTQAGPPESPVPSNPQPGHCYLLGATQMFNCNNIVLNCPSGGFCYCPTPGIGCMPASTYCCVCQAARRCVVRAKADKITVQQLISLCWGGPSEARYGLGKPKRRNARWPRRGGKMETPLVTSWGMGAEKGCASRNVQLSFFTRSTTQGFF